MRPSAILLPLVLLCSSAFSAPVESTDFGLKYESWAIACELVLEDDYSSTGCLGIRPPTVMLVAGTRARGYYEGAEAIYIAKRLQPGVDQQSTVIHEMIHYIHAQRGELRTPSSLPEAAQLCASEATAFRLVDRWLLRMNQAKRLRGPEWWKAYWHCEPHYDPDFNAGRWFLRGIAR